MYWHVPNIKKFWFELIISNGLLFCHWKNSALPFRTRDILDNLDKYQYSHGCWCPGSLFCQVINSFGAANWKLEQLEACILRIPPAASWLPIPLSHIGSQVKRRQSQSYKFKEFAKISNFLTLKQTLHTTHLLKLLDKMCKYKMDPMSIVEDSERTRFCRQTDKVKPVYSLLTPPSTLLKRGYNKWVLHFHEEGCQLPVLVQCGQWRNEITCK